VKDETLGRDGWIESRDEVREQRGTEGAPDSPTGLSKLACIGQARTYSQRQIIHDQTATHQTEPPSMFASSRSTTAVAAARQSMRTFSSTPTSRSKIGSAPLSLPQEVQFNILPRANTAGGAAARRGRGGVSQSGHGSTVEISGPLGSMKMDIPAYMSIQENEANRTRTLHILDAEDRKQREMWGE